MRSKCVSSWTISVLRLLSGLLACLLWSSANVAAQTACPAPCSLTVGQTFSLNATHDGANTTGYRVYLDGVKVGADLPLSALTSGSVSVAALVAPARGSHTVQLGAFNPDSETKSDPLSFTTTLPAPSKSGPVRIVITVTTAEDGSMQFRIVGIEPVPGGVSP